MKTAARGPWLDARAAPTVSLGYVDMVMAALGADVHTGENGAAGSIGVHRLAKRFNDVRLNAEGTGYVIALAVPGIVTQVQANMAAALNSDWVLRLAADLMAETGYEIAFSDLVPPVPSLRVGPRLTRAALGRLCRAARCGATQIERGQRETRESAA